MLPFRDIQLQHERTHTFDWVAACAQPNKDLCGCHTRTLRTFIIHHWCAYYNMPKSAKIICNYTQYRGPKWWNNSGDKLFEMEMLTAVKMAYQYCLNDIGKIKPFSTTSMQSLHHNLASIIIPEKRWKVTETHWSLAIAYFKPTPMMHLQRAICRTKVLLAQYLVVHDDNRCIYSSEDILLDLNSCITLLTRKVESGNNEKLSKRDKYFALQRVKCACRLRFRIRNALPEYMGRENNEHFLHDDNENNIFHCNGNPMQVKMCYGFWKKCATLRLICAFLHFYRNNCSSQRKSRELDETHARR